jgi:predicted DNA repair protein MutK
MSLGLIALLDDVAAIARMAAASLDDVAAQSAKAGAKAAGVVIDDAAVTPGYVVGFSPERELPMIGRIALGSLRNKLVILLPVGLALGQFAPWAITPLLMLGGLYLVYEGAEKVYEAIAPGGAHAHEEKTGAEPAGSAPHALETSRVNSAVRTDFILSAEIMALTLASVADRDLITQALVLAVVGVLITGVVYGAVALIVKADDAGLRLVRRGGVWAGLGRTLVKGMPPLLKGLTVVGTAAMLWVGGGILVHGLAHYGLTGVEHALEAVGHATAAILPFPALSGWAAQAAGSGLLGLAVGFAAIPLVEAASRLRKG